MFGWFKKTSPPKEETPVKKVRSNIFVMCGSYYGEDLLEEDWNGIAIYDDAIVMRGGETQVVIDENGIKTTGDVVAFSND